jgi:hypothetical protein
MSNQQPEAHRNVYRQNVGTGATPNSVIPNPDAIDEEFIESANRILSNAVELIRVLIGAHQSAIAIVQEDWSSIRKFSRSRRSMRRGQNTIHLQLDMAPTDSYCATINPSECPKQNSKPILNGKGFGNEAGKHPPMRGWLAAPIVGQDTTDWRLLQLPNKYEEKFTEEDEKHFISFAKLVSETLEAL